MGHLYIFLLQKLTTIGLQLFTPKHSLDWIFYLFWATTNTWWDPNKPVLRQGTPSSPSPSRGPITRGMLKKIQLGFIQDGSNPYRLLTLFTWAKEDVKIWRGVSKSNRITIRLAHCLGLVSRIISQTMCNWIAKVGLD